jgi:hypothetical protein
VALNSRGSFAESAVSFMIVRREQRAAAVGLVQMLDRRPGDRQSRRTVAVPRPISSKNHQRAFAGLMRMTAVSTISTMKVDRPRRDRRRRRPARTAGRRMPMRARVAGTKLPVCANQRDQRVFCAKRSILPAMLGPVISQILTRILSGPGERSQALAIKGLAVALQRLFDHRMPAAFDRKASEVSTSGRT